jgi:hypothetical protein
MMIRVPGSITLSSVMFSSDLVLRADYNQAVKSYKTSNGFGSSGKIQLRCFAGARLQGRGCSRAVISNKNQQRL